MVIVLIVLEVETHPIYRTLVSVYRKNMHGTGTSTYW